MRIHYPIILILTILLSTFTYAQKIDSLILKNNIPKIENPNIKHLGSLHKKFNNSLNKLSEKGYLVSTKEYQAPNFYHVQNDGTEISLNDFLYEKLEKSTNSFKAYFKIEVEWNGRINYVKLVGYIGNIDNIDFISLWKNIKANPATEFNIPAKTIVTIPISKN
ncbi:hypothetical protein A9Q86_02945 [Flavobacteriales bacterium 33_180_T64]|nr:hypothetical protein A9Q86_02945 [Flavobacteriales bacterium 33_180_T64]